MKAIRRMIVLSMVAACSSAGTQEIRVEERAAPAPGWTVAETNGAGTPARWSAAATEAGAPAARVVSQNEGQTFNLLLSEASYGPDLRVSTRLFADSGDEDMGGGLVWRAVGPDDYYVARWNPLEDNVRAYRVTGGSREMIATADVRLDPFAWHDFAVSARGERCRVSMDGRELLSFEDPTFQAPGLIGLWTKADACTTFALPVVGAAE